MIAHKISRAQVSQNYFPRNNSKVKTSGCLCGVLFNELNPSPFPQVRGKTFKFANFGYFFNISTFNGNQSLSIVQTTKQFLAVVVSWEEPPNI